MIQNDVSLYSTLTRKVERLNPLQEGHISIYACGITVYDDAHLGHARQAIVFDVLRRYLEFQGHKVSYIRNYTDVDDKIINRARERRVDPIDLSQEYIERTRADLAALGVRPATKEPKVTDHIEEILQFIRRLIDKGVAYVGGGDVLFDVSKYPQYGKLSNRRLEDCQNADDSPHKRQPQDFVLWKAAKPGEPSWISPWGSGRPGWHIECSAMAKAHLGDTIDIHGGGSDLVFPHHENEIAQSEAANDAPLAQYWVHNGLVMVNGKKMSKSFGNFLTIRDVLKQFHPEIVRHIVLSHKYSSNIDFKLELFVDATIQLVNGYQAVLQLAEAGLRLPTGSLKGEMPPGFEDSDLGSRFCKAMDSDFNTAVALTELHSALGQLRKDAIKREGARTPQDFKEITNALEQIQSMAAILGLFNEEPKAFLDEIKKWGIKQLAISDSEIQELIAERKSLKNLKQYNEADKVRKLIESKGVVLMDSPSGETEWAPQIRAAAESAASKLVFS